MYCGWSSVCVCVCMRVCAHQCVCVCVCAMLCTQGLARSNSGLEFNREGHEITLGSDCFLSLIPSLSLSLSFLLFLSLSFSPCLFSSPDSLFISLSFSLFPFLPLSLSLSFLVACSSCSHHSNSLCTSLSIISFSLHSIALSPTLSAIFCISLLIYFPFFILSIHPSIHSFIHSSINLSIPQPAVSLA